MQSENEKRYLVVEDPDVPNRYFIYEQLPYPITPGEDSVPEDSFRSLSDGPGIRGAELDPSESEDLIMLARSGSLGFPGPRP